jgi:hypothetical protein
MVQEAKIAYVSSAEAEFNILTAGKRSSGGQCALGSSAEAEFINRVVQEAKIPQVS